MNTRKLDYNVIFPSNEQEYYPQMLYEGVDGRKSLNEVDIVEKVLADDIASGKKHVTIVLLKSPPGVGKTVFAAYLAKKHGCPYQIINCVSTMTDMDLLGSYVLIDKETCWQDGPLAGAIRAANDYGLAIICINELNALTLQAQLALNPLMDKQECVVLTLNNNEVVKVNDGCHLLIMASMNPDIMGVNELQDSVADRANVVLYMDYPTPQRESEIMEKITGLCKENALGFANVIAECRKLKQDRKLVRAPSSRGLIDWINYSKMVGVKTAFEVAVVNKYGTTEEERKALRLVAQGKGYPSLTSAVKTMGAPKVAAKPIGIAAKPAIAAKPVLTTKTGTPIKTVVMAKPAITSKPVVAAKPASTPTKSSVSAAVEKRAVRNFIKWCDERKVKSKARMKKIEEFNAKYGLGLTAKDYSAKYDVLVAKLKAVLKEKKPEFFS